MTNATPRVSDEELTAIESRARGADVGPWTAIRHPRHNHDAHSELWEIFAGEPDDCSSHQIAQVIAYNALENAAHIIGLSPDKAIALVSGFRDARAKIKVLEAERDEARAKLSETLDLWTKDHFAVEREAERADRAEAALARAGEVTDEMLHEAQMWIGDHVALKDIRLGIEAALARRALAARKPEAEKSEVEG